VLGGPDPYSGADAINTRGQIVGLGESFSGSSHGLLWQNNTLIDLGTLGGDYSAAVAINARGDVVGQAETASGEFHDVLWSSRDETAIFTVAVDIRPASPNNNVNPNSNVLIPVAILGTNSFDVSTIDEGSLGFGPNQAVPEGGAHFRDVDHDG